MAGAVGRLRSRGVGGGRAVCCIETGVLRCPWAQLQAKCHSLGRHARS